MELAADVRIERLALPASEPDLRALALLLVDAVASGAAVSFLGSLTVEQAHEWWRKITTGAHPAAVFLVARGDDGIVGSVQMHPAWAPNQPHRADVAKLLVHRRWRRAGLGARLMHALEDAARAGGFSLLTLDARRGGAAEALYRRLGWTYVGVIPRFAVDPDGTTPHDTVIFYKELHRAGARPPESRAEPRPERRPELRPEPL
jgi:GNAT superfamily N-acetyltransferase